MIVETRKTAQGTEYWDNVAKKSLFVPAGKKPPFDVTTEYDSMIGGIDFASGKDLTALNIKILGVNDGQKDYDLNNMKIKDLKELAADNDIKIPSNVTKRDDIAQYIFDNWTSDDE